MANLGALARKSQAGEKVRVMPGVYTPATDAGAMYAKLENLVQPPTASTGGTSSGGVSIF